MNIAPDVTCFRNCGWIVAWNVHEQRLGFLREGDFVFRGPDIIYVGGHYDGPLGNEVDGSHLMVMPGLINAHHHSTAMMIRNGLSTEGGSYIVPYFYTTQRVLVPDDRDKGVATEAAMARLLLSGTTTTMDWVSPYEGWVDVLARSGIRAYAAPAYNSARVAMRANQDLVYEWFADGGALEFRAALDAMAEAEGHSCGRLSAMVAPSELECCSEWLLRESKAVAESTGRPFQVHASEAVREFFEIACRHGMSPIQWCSKLGLLGGKTAIGHAVYLDHHSKVQWPEQRDLALLAETGTTVTHTPAAWAAVGDGLETLASYLRAGINIALGNDAFPHGMIDELKTAVFLGRVKSGKDCGTPMYPIEGGLSIGARQVLEAATVGGARFLGRDDIGKLAVGCKADFFTVDLRHPDMMPIYDPLRSLIYSAGQRAICDVYVDGRQVVRNGILLTMDLNDVSARLQNGQNRLVQEIPSKESAFGREAASIWPLSLPVDVPLSTYRV
ncbi:amidohydrolase family protein [Mesorhizobium sp.]|uniref:amidohydrolase family protein n=1 Tax=Mesorhizobium sp. TaxID=1871066 RepID=UPI0025D5F7A6|nr:amidohydrolase family protein [Mesorhizobium sp.]